MGTGLINYLMLIGSGWRSANVSQVRGSAGWADFSQFSPLHVIDFARNHLTARFCHSITNLSLQIMVLFKSYDAHH